jgi:hypothetical protein
MQPRTLHKNLARPATSPMPVIQLGRRLPAAADAAGRPPASGFRGGAAVMFLIDTHAFRPAA